MNVWAIANQKGGVGKTTTAVSLAGWLSKRGKRVLLIDFDPHGSLTAYFGGDPDASLESGYDLFRAAAEKRQVDLGDLVQRTGFPGLSMLPAATALATLDRQLGTREGMGLVLKRALLGQEEQFDYVLIDCPPMLGLLMINALAACDQVIIPVQTEFLALKGLDRMLHTLGMLAKSSRAELAYVVVPTFFDRRTRAAQEARRRLHQRYKDHLWDAVIPVDTQFRDASRQGVPLPLFNEDSRGAQSYLHLLNCLPGPDQRRPLNSWSERNAS